MKKLEEFQREAKESNDLRGYHVKPEDFNWLICYCDFEVINQFTLDNCYINKIRSPNGTLFKTITEEKMNLKSLL